MYICIYVACDDVPAEQGYPRRQKVAEFDHVRIHLRPMFLGEVYVLLRPVVEHELSVRRELA
jgi:hypothetical protein